MNPEGLLRSLCAAALLLLVASAAAGPSADVGTLTIRHDRERDLAAWTPAIAAYSLRHYGEDTWVLHPTCMVLHYTAGRQFPWNLVRSTDFAGETPGLASHFVIDGSAVWQILPPTVRSRGAYGINHRAINIEMVAADAADLTRRPETLRTCAALVTQLMREFSIPTTHVYGHSEVASMNRSLVPEVLDLVNPAAYHKVDPGPANLRAIKAMLQGN